MFVIPVEQDNPVRNRPLMVYALIAVLVVVFGVTQHLLSWESVLARFGFVPAAFSWLTALSSMFLHAGYLHLLGNLLFFWVFADNVEDVLGPAAFLVIFLLCGLAGTGLHYAFNADSVIPCIGASGAISGVVGLYMVFFRHAHVDIAVYLKQWRVAVFYGTALGASAVWFAEQALLGTLSQFTANEELRSVSFWAHVGGGLGGVFLGLLLRLAGVRAQPPETKLHFERESVSSIWCPHCGTLEAQEGFGDFQCPACGTCYEVVQVESQSPFRRK